MGCGLHFNDEQWHMIKEAIDAAEDLVTDYFNISPHEWRSYRYEFKTLAHLSNVEIADTAFAQICKYECMKGRVQGSRSYFDLYRICLQDDKILNAVNRSPNKIKLRPLLLYVVTHELSHVVRFGKHLKDFFAPPKEKELEEANVHSFTYEMLRSKGDQDLNCVLNHYRTYRGGSRLFSLFSLV